MKETVNEKRNFFIEGVKKKLEDAGVDIHEPEFMEKESFVEFKDAFFLGGKEGRTTYREIIERYMLSNSEIINLYRSKYDMGNIVPLSEEDCQYTVLAGELCRIFSNEINVDAKEFYRLGGLRDRVRKCIGIDFKLYEDINDSEYDENVRQIFKIMYLFYYLEHAEYPDRNILKMLEDESCENVDNSVIGVVTSNGAIMKALKDSVERELPIEFRGLVKKTLWKIVSDWERIIKESCMVMDYAEEYGESYDLDIIISKYSQIAEKLVIRSVPKAYHMSPNELLYLKLAQHENRGKEKDIIFVNRIKTEYQERTSEQIEIMLELRNFIVEREKAGEYITVYLNEISELVYLRKEVSDKENKTILSSIDKVEKILDFFMTGTKMFFGNGDKLNVTFIISCLQVILLSEQSEEFIYRFPAYHKISKSYRRVQGALKGEEKVVFEALQAYFIRKVMECYNCNIGRKHGKDIITKVEIICDTLLHKILQIPDIETMKLAHDYYVKAIQEDIISFPQRRFAFDFISEEIEKFHYTYIDPENLIGEMFFESSIMKENLEELISRITKNIEEDDGYYLSYDYEVCNPEDETVVKTIHSEVTLNNVEKTVHLIKIKKEYAEKYKKRFEEVGISLG